MDREHGDDVSCRPNQVFAISLPHPELERDRWEPALSVVRNCLRMPMGRRQPLAA